jgi:hypothetical protein
MFPFYHLPTVCTTFRAVPAHRIVGARNDNHGELRRSDNKFRSRTPKVFGPERRIHPAG